jgi:hypothetical protein
VKCFDKTVEIINLYEKVFNSLDKWMWIPPNPLPKEDESKIIRQDITYIAKKMFRSRRYNDKKDRIECNSRFLKLYQELYKVEKEKMDLEF